jgi:ribulose-5-phosphate 4-epimerase/fuculose-1-phosphate aldolase
MMVRDECSPEEWQVRCDLAACYRLVALHGWDDILATHISARIPGRHDMFLINPFGMTFDEITASSLLRVNMDGEIVGESEYAANPAGFTIHSAVHEARPDAGCVIHLHTLDGMAVSATEEGLLPLNQVAIICGRGIAYHDYEGVATNLAERERIQRDLGDRRVMILRNHGTLALGATVAEAFIRIYMLERACSAQVRTLSMGRPLVEAAQGALSRTSEANDRLGNYGQLAWPALLRRLDRTLPGYAA